MALTKEWVSAETPALILPRLRWGAYYRIVQVFSPWPDGVLLRAVARCAVTVFVPSAGSMPPADWWTSTYMELRMTWTPDGTFPDPTIGVREPGDLGRSLMTPTAFGDSTLTHPYAVKFEQAEELDVHSMRKPPAGNVASVGANLYDYDRVHGLDGSFDVEINVAFTLDVLWGH